MTVCIGALCAAPGPNGPLPNQMAVIAADRMVTLGGFIEFEHEIPKIAQITPNVLALVAGDTLRGAKVVKAAKDQFRLGADNAESIAQSVAQHYGNLRREEIDGTIFHPRGITLQQFYFQGLQNQILPQIVGGLDQQVISFDYGVEILLAGVDGSGSHLYSVTNPGRFADFNQIGYAAIGSGSIHAVQALIGFGHSGNHGLWETVFTVYAAKRRAEVAPGVGSDTDLRILGPGGIAIALDNDQLSKLKGLYEEYNKPISQELESRVIALNLFGLNQQGNENVNSQPNDGTGRAPNGPEPDDTPTAN